MRVKSPEHSVGQGARGRDRRGPRGRERRFTTLARRQGEGAVVPLRTVRFIILNIFSLLQEAP
jgi:hypothetical protein